MDAKEIKCPLQWWKKHEFVFLTLGFPACQKVSIEGSKINLKRYQLQLKNLENLIFFITNWFNDPKVDCKTFF